MRRPTFTAAELEEMRRADAEIERSFRWTPEEVAEIARAKKDGRLALFPENTSITIPDVITSLGAVAFTCAATIPSITIPEGLERIGAGVFDDCLTLQEGAPK